MIAWTTCETCGFRWFSDPPIGCPLCNPADPIMHNHGGRRRDRWWLPWESNHR
jgi:hypothetical protein